VPDYSLREHDVFAFVAIPVLLLVCLTLAVAVASRRLGEGRAAHSRAIATLIGGAVWMAAWWAIASSGALRRWDAAPPPLAIVVASVLVVSLLVAFGRYGRRLALGIPLWVLIAVQGFRLPLELAMHSMYERGIMPAPMSYSGQNFDIVTGATALVVAAVVRGNRRRWLAVIWNVVGFGLLVNIVMIAILATPLFQYFGPSQVNVFVTYPPFIWLPTVMVTAALTGHLVIGRALWLGRRTEAPSVGAA
jgi:hypothetical protein